MRVLFVNVLLVMALDLSRLVLLLSDLATNGFLTICVFQRQSHHALCVGTEDVNGRVEHSMDLWHYIEGCQIATRGLSHAKS